MSSGSNWPIRELMTGDLVTLRAADTVGRARQILGDTGLHALPIIDDGRTVGIVTLADCEHHAEYEHLGDLSIEVPITIDVEATAGEAAIVMRSEHIHHLLVSEGERGEVVGILSSLDLLFPLTR